MVPKPLKVLYMAIYRSELNIVTTYRFRTECSIFQEEVFAISKVAKYMYINVTNTHAILAS